MSQRDNYLFISVELSMDGSVLLPVTLDAHLYCDHFNRMNYKSSGDYFIVSVVGGR